MLEDLKYAIKVAFSVDSGYIGLAQKDDDGDFCLIGYTAKPAGRGLTTEWNLDDYPYYVCAEFRNGRHIPLPLILGDTEDIGPLQRLALRMSFPNNRLITQSALDCLQDCATYDDQFNAQYPVPEPAEVPAQDTYIGWETLEKLRAGEF